MRPAWAPTLAALAWSLLVGLLALGGVLVSIETPLGDAVDRLSPPSPPRGQTFLIHLAPEDGPAACRALFQAAEAQGVSELIVLDEVAASSLPARAPFRVRIAARLVHDPQLERPPHLDSSTQDERVRALDLPSDPDGTWRRVKPALDVVGERVATLFGDHTERSARLALVRASAVVSLPAARARAETSPAPWKGGRWVVARPTLSEPAVWTPRQERVRESRAVALALLALDEGHILRPSPPLWIALAAGLLFVLCAFPAPAEPRLSALWALSLAGATLVALVALRSTQLIEAPILPLVASAPLGFVFRLLRSERRIRERVTWLSDDLRRDRSLTPLRTPGVDAAALEALVSLSGARAAALRVGDDVVVFASPDAGEGASEGVLEAARALLPLEGVPLVETSAGPGVLVELGEHVRVGILPAAGSAGEAEDWWRGRARLLAACLRPLVPVAGEGGGESELVFLLRASVQGLALERAFTIRVLSQLPEAVAIYDGLGRPLLVNARFDELAQRFPGAQGLPQLLSELSENSVSETFASVAEVLQSEHSISTYVTLEPEGIHHALVVESLEIEGHGRFLVLLARDVTELFALERSRGLLLQGLSDEIRAALQRISLGVDLLKLKLGKEAVPLASSFGQLRDYIDEAVSSMANAERRGSVGVEVALGEPGPLDLALEVARAMEQVAPTAAQLGSSIERVGQRFTSVVWARSKQLRDALALALTDMLLAVGEGGRVQLRLLEERDGVRVLLEEAGEASLEVTVSETLRQLASSAEVEFSLANEGAVITLFVPRAPPAESGEPE